MYQCLSISVPCTLLEVAQQHLNKYLEKEKIIGDSEIIGLK
jgi:hypothetical protein